MNQIAFPFFMLLFALQSVWPLSRSVLYSQSECHPHRAFLASHTPTSTDSCLFEQPEIYGMRRRSFRASRMMVRISGQR